MWTTLNIDNRILAIAKHRAIEQGVTLTCVVENALRDAFSGLLELGFQDFPYVLSYQVLQDEVQIIAILHTARDREHALTMRAGMPTTGQ